MATDTATNLGTGTIVFVGDELTATGFRLAGIETLVASPDGARDALAAARARADLILLTAEHARQIPPGELDLALIAEAPIVAVIPDILMHARPPDLARRLRAVLGIET
jgi:vacuolar-type H+-ATPase subunit F/Vma7